MTSSELAKPNAAPTFYPPKPNKPLVWLVQRLNAQITQWKCRATLVVAKDEIKRLKVLKQDRVIYFANHPTFGEPVLMYELSARLHKQIYFMAAYELFQGPMRHFFQGVGAYSIRRGLVDRKSIKQTIDLLRQPACHLGIFPEGRCSFQSDRLMEFQPGGVQLAFQALSKLPLGDDGKAPKLYAVPVSIYYQYEGDLRGPVEETLVELEAALDLPSLTETLPDPLPEEAIAKLPPQAYARLKRVALGILQRVEADCQAWDLSLPELNDENWNARLDALRDGILDRCEQLVGLSSNQGQPRRNRAYRIQAALADRKASLNAAVSGSGDNETEAAFPTLLIKRSIERLLNLDTIYDGYVRENPTPERFLDSMARFQREIFQIDQPPPKRQRQAKMKIGEPINFADYLEAYRSDRNGTVSQLCNQLQNEMQTNLTAMVEAARADIAGVEAAPNAPATASEKNP